MPHAIIEYSANLEPELNYWSLVEAVHMAALETGVFPVGGLRTRAAKREAHRIADGHPDNGYVHLILKIGHGRDFETKKEAGEAVFAALCEFLQPLYDTRPLAISFEIQEIDKDLNFKKNNLHEHVRRRQEG